MNISYSFHSIFLSFFIIYYFFLINNIIYPINIYQIQSIKNKSNRKIQLLNLKNVSNKKIIEIT
jgi:hypothetical protein